VIVLLKDARRESGSESALRPNEDGTMDLEFGFRIRMWPGYWPGERRRAESQRFRRSLSPGQTPAQIVAAEALPCACGRPRHEDSFWEGTFLDPARGRWVCVGPEGAFKTWEEWDRQAYNVGNRSSQENVAPPAESDRGDQQR